MLAQGVIAAHVPLQHGRHERQDDLAAIGARIPVSSDLAQNLYDGCRLGQQRRDFGRQARLLQLRAMERGVRAETGGGKSFVRRRGAGCWRVRRCSFDGKRKHLQPGAQVPGSGS